jgi:hypothetical protein
MGAKTRLRLRRDVEHEALHTLEPEAIAWRVFSIAPILEAKGADNEAEVYAHQAAQRVREAWAIGRPECIHLDIFLRPEDWS